jgi:hypothetical protein
MGWAIDHGDLRAVDDVKISIEPQHGHHISGPFPQLEDGGSGKRLYWT